MDSGLHITLNPDPIVAQIWTVNFSLWVHQGLLFGLIAKHTGPVIVPFDDQLSGMNHDPNQKYLLPMDIIFNQTLIKYPLLAEQFTKERGFT